MSAAVCEHQWIDGPGANDGSTCNHCGAVTPPGSRHPADHAGRLIDAAERAYAALLEALRTIAPEHSIGALLHMLVMTWIDKLADEGRADRTAPQVDQIGRAIATIDGRALATPPSRAPRQLLAEAAYHVLRRQQLDPDFGYYLSPGTESFALLCKAWAAHTYVPLEQVIADASKDCQPAHRKREPDVVVLRRRVQELEAKRPSEGELRDARIAGVRAAASFLHGRAVGSSDERDARAWQVAADELLEECGEHGAFGGAQS